MMATTINITIFYHNLETKIVLSEEDAIEDLKHEIYKELSIKPSKQIIRGLLIEPTNDETLLMECLDISDEIYLILEHKDQINQENNDTDGQNHPPPPIINTIDSEYDLDYQQDQQDQIKACMSFKWKFINNFTYTAIKFQLSTLRDFISLLIEENTMGVLYFHNINDSFAEDFCTVINKMLVSQMFEKINFLGWDIEETTYHSALIKALNEFSQLNFASSIVENKQSCALILVPHEMDVVVFSKFTEVSEVTLIEYFKEASRLRENEDEEVQEEEIVAFGSEEYQKLMADMLGDRDYDSFDFDQHFELKSKIGFALFGPPQDESSLDYTKKQKGDIDMLYDVIVKESNLFSQFKDQVQISFIYNCTEPLAKEKEKRAKKFTDYDPKTDMCPLPVFVLRKCRDSENPCRVFVDHTGRVYDTWTGYLERNKIEECVMVVPKNGMYRVNEKEEVLLEKYCSPACGVGVKILQATDIGSVVGGIASGGVFAAAAIPAVVMAPAALIAAGVVGAGVGVYSIGRSIHNIVDRTKHKQSMSFANSEARGAYLNIVAGSLGFAGAGASILVSQLTSQGVNLGLGARMLFNSINVANLGAGGISLGNSIYDVINEWIRNNQRPSALMMVQLSSSILFFGNAVYNFRTAGTIIEETQARTMQELSDSMRSNRHRKTFNRIVKSTLTEHGGDSVKANSAVISAVRNFQNKDEVMAVLTRTTTAFKEKGVKVVASDGKITLNGIAVDMDSMTGFTKKDMGNVLNNLDSYRSTGTSSEVSDMNAVKRCITSVSPPNIDTIINVVWKLYSGYNNDFKAYIAKALALLLPKLQSTIINTIESVIGQNFLPEMTKVVLKFFLNEAKSLEDQYWKWKRTGDPQHYNIIFKYFQFTPNSKKILNLLQCVLCRDFVNGMMVQDALKQLVDYTYNWIAKIVYDKENEKERTQQNRVYSVRRRVFKIQCNTCKGHHYSLPN